MKWTDKYPTKAGYYWVRSVGMVETSGMIECFFLNPVTQEIYASDINFEIYGREDFKGYMFSDTPIEKPEWSNDWEVSK